MSEFDEDAMIAWSADWPVEKEDAHCTVQYLGDINELSYSKIDARAVIMEQMQLVVPVLGTELFGPEDRKVHVATLDPDFELGVLQGLILDRMDALGMEYNTDWPDYRPHVTFDPDTAGEVPESITLSGPYLYWGTEVL